MWIHKIKNTSFFFYLFFFSLHSSNVLELQKQQDLFIGAVVERNHKYIKTTLENGLSPHFLARSNHTPLDLAFKDNGGEIKSFKQRYDIVELLIKHGAQPKVTLCNILAEALMLITNPCYSKEITDENALKLLKLLLNNGADVHRKHKTYSGEESIIHFARRMDIPVKFMELLFQYGAEPSHEPIELYGPENKRVTLI